MRSPAEWCEQAAVLTIAGAHPDEVLRDLPADITDVYRNAIQSVAGISRVLGTPVTTGLRALAEAFRRAEALHDSHQAALAAPRAATRMLLALPIGSAGLGYLLGFDTVGFLFGNPLGWACLGVGVGLSWMAMRWSRRLLADAANVDRLPGFGLVLFELAINSGATLERALEVTRSTWTLSTRETEALEHAARDSANSGASLASVLHARYESLVRATERTANMTAARLPVRLTVPLALGILPAFVFLGVLPLLASALAATNQTLIVT